MLHEASFVSLSRHGSVHSLSVPDGGTGESAVLALEEPKSEADKLKGMDSMKEAQRLCDKIDANLNVFIVDGSREVAVSIEIDVGVSRNH